MQAAKAATTHETPTITILAAIAREADVDVTDLEEPLYDAIDPDALDRLLQHGTGVSVTFEYDGRTISVSGDGSVNVADPDGGDQR